MAPVSVSVIVHPDSEAYIASLLIKKVKIPNDYLDFVNVFSEKKALVLPKRTKFNEYVINLEDGKQPLYELIYSLDPRELETLKLILKPI